MRGDDPWSSPDPLGEALHFLRVDGAFYCRSELTAPWGLSLPAFDDCLWFHVVTTGEAHLEVEGVEPLLLRPGDLALVAHAQGHRVCSGPEAGVPDVTTLPHEYQSDRYAILRHGGGGARTTLICGAVRFGQAAARELLALLPPVLFLEPSRSPRTEWLQSTLRLIADEASTLRPGGEAVLTRLSDIVVLQAIRTWLERDPLARTGWLGALQDRQIGRAVSLVHRHPERDWSVASLAGELAMSRSAFAARFTELVHEPVMSWVTRHRMQVALDWLRHEDLAVGELANRLGYQSEAAFSRAFKRVVGVSPGAARRTGERRRAPSGSLPRPG